MLLIAVAFCLASTVGPLAGGWWWLLSWALSWLCGAAFGKALARFEMAVEIKATAELLELINSVLAPGLESLERKKGPPAEAGGRVEDERGA